MQWHIVTGEYPPVLGGVADYTRLVARGLVACGDAVTVWTPTGGPAAGHRAVAVDDGVNVETLPDHFGPRSLAHLDRQLRRSCRPHRLLVQYVPHAFGWKGTNVPFCLWLRSQPRASTWVMFHEVAYPIARQQRLALNGLGVVTRGMAALAASAASRIFVSIPAWEPMVRRVAPVGTPIEWLPVPSVVPVYHAPTRVAAIREQIAGKDGVLVGHFGTFGQLIRPLVLEAIPQVAHETGGHVLLLGRGSETVAADILGSHPRLRGRIHGTGALEAAQLSLHISACDCMVQPYPDGVSSRRTSAMAALAHGRPLVTTSGVLTENTWEETSAVELSPTGDAKALARACAALVADPGSLGRRAFEARAFYDARFDLTHTLARLRVRDDPAMLRAAC